MRWSNSNGPGTEAKARKALAEFVTQGVAPGCGSSDVRTAARRVGRAQSRPPKTLDEAKREIENQTKPRLGRIRLAKMTAKQPDDAYSASRRRG